MHTLKWLLQTPPQPLCVVRAADAKASGCKSLGHGGHNPHEYAGLDRLVVTVCRAAQIVHPDEQTQKRMS